MPKQHCLLLRNQVLISCITPTLWTSSRSEHLRHLRTLASKTKRRKKNWMILTPSLRVELLRKSPAQAKNLRKSQNNRGNQSKHFSVNGIFWQLISSQKVSNHFQSTTGHKNQSSTYHQWELLRVHHREQGKDAQRKAHIVIPRKKRSHHKLN